MFVTVAPKKRELLANLTPAIGASGPHDFAVHFSRARQSQLSRPSLPDPRFVTNAHTPLWWDGMARNKQLIWVKSQESFLKIRNYAEMRGGLICADFDRIMPETQIPADIVRGVR